MNAESSPAPMSESKGLGTHQELSGADKKKKGALARIKDSLKAIPSKIRSGMKSLANKIKSPFKKKTSSNTDSKELRGSIDDTNGKELRGNIDDKDDKKPGLFSRTKTQVADMGRAIADKGSALWKALSPTKKDKSPNKVEDIELEEVESPCVTLGDFLSQADPVLCKLLLESLLVRREDSDPKKTTTTSGYRIEVEAEDSESEEETYDEKEDLASPGGGHQQTVTAQQEGDGRIMLDSGPNINGDGKEEGNKETPQTPL